MDAPRSGWRAAWDARLRSCLPDRHVEALEICTFTSSAAEAQDSALDGDRRRVTSAVSRTWWVYVGPTSLNLGEFLSGRTWDRLEAAIGVLDANGLDGFNQGELRGRTATSSASRRLQDSGRANCSRCGTQTSTSPQEQ